MSQNSYSSPGVKVLRYSIVGTTWLMLFVGLAVLVMIIGCKGLIEQLSVELHDGGLAAAFGFRDTLSPDGRVYWQLWPMVLLTIGFAIATLACDWHEREGFAPVPFFLTFCCFLFIFCIAFTRYQAYWGKFV